MIKFQEKLDGRTLEIIVDDDVDLYELTTAFCEFARALSHSTENILDALEHTSQDDSRTFWRLT